MVRREHTPMLGLLAAAGAVVSVLVACSANPAAGQGTAPGVFASSGLGPPPSTVGPSSPGTTRPPTAVPTLTPSGVSVTGPVPPTGAARADPAYCTSPHARPSPGAAASLGITVGDAIASSWSASVGWVQAENAADGTVFAIHYADRSHPDQTACVVALRARSGERVWAWDDPRHGPIMGVSAGSGLVLVGLGTMHGGPPAGAEATGTYAGPAATAGAAELDSAGPTSSAPQRQAAAAGVAAYDLTNRLVALDAATGEKRWTLPLRGDGQHVPAVIAGNTVVVMQADGTVIGLDADNGSREWGDPTPTGCHANAPAGIDPLATPLPAAPAATVTYDCTHRVQVTRLDPATGHVRWTTPLPHGYSVEAAATASDANGHGVMGLLLNHFGHPTPAAPVRKDASLAPDVATASILALDPASGQPRWQVDHVPPSSALLAGSGQLCAVSPFGVACHAASTAASGAAGSEAGGGTLTWFRRPPVTPRNGAPGPLSAGARALNGQLFRVVPTAAAAAIPAQSTTYRSKPGTFELHRVDLATGHIESRLPLPAFYRGRNGVVVSPMDPPGVVAATGHRVLVDPQLGGTYVIEAFAR